jgi:hypothetical protein
MEYERLMVKTYGQDVVDEIRAAKNRTVTFSRHELADMRDEYKSRIKAQEQRLGK